MNMHTTLIDTTQPAPLPKLRMTKIPDRGAICDNIEVSGQRTPVKVLARRMIAAGYDPNTIIEVFYWYTGEKLYEHTLGELAAKNTPKAPTSLPGTAQAPLASAEATTHG